MQKNHLLYEVSYIRSFTIFFLVFVHSFIKIGAGGSYAREYFPNPVYELIVYVFAHFIVELFSFLAGYVWAYQLLDLGRRYGLFEFIKKKAKRLLLPMLFFGFFYLLLFFYPSSYSIDSLFLMLLSGPGHLWFLLVLFWSFIILWFIDHFRLSSVGTLLILAVLSFIPHFPWPFGFGKLPHLLFFMFCGYLLRKHHEIVQKKFMNPVAIILIWILFVVLVVILAVVNNNDEMIMLSDGIFSSRILSYGLSSIWCFFEACCVISALYLTVCFFTTKNGFVPNRYVVSFNKYCYGVYMFHQFVYVFLYFKMPLYDMVHPYLLPWVGFLITISISLLLTKLILKTHLGRFLIG